MIEAEERELIESIIEFGDTVVREVMVPRPDMVTRRRRLPRRRRHGGRADRTGCSRLPVVRRGHRRHRRHRLRQGPHARRARRPRRPSRSSELVRPAHFVPETKRVAELLREMQAQQVPHGDRRRRVRRHRRAGHPRGPPRGARRRDRRRVRRRGARWSSRSPTAACRVHGPHGRSTRSTTCSACELPEGDWDTVGGLVFHLLGHVPDEGETVELRRPPARGPSRCRAAASAWCASSASSGRPRRRRTTPTHAVATDAGDRHDTETAR